MVLAAQTNPDATPRTWNRWLPSLLVLPALLYLLPIYLLSLGILFAFTFFVYVPGGPLLNPNFTLANYLRLIDPLYGAILLRTVIIGAIASAVAVFISYPVAYWLNRSTSRWRSLVLGCTVLSFFVVPVVRVFAWTVVLGTKGFLNHVLALAGIIDRPLPLMYNNFGVTLVLAHYLLPLTTLTLTAALQRLDGTLELASANLGATKTKTFFTVTLPLSVPGLVAALTLAFAISMSTFTTPIIIGGGRVQVLANTIYDAMMISHNFPLASAFAVVALIMTLGIIGMVGHFMTTRLKLA